MNINEIRTKYLKFYQARGHAVVPSDSLLPENDPTTLFTSAGMQPMIPFLMGQKHPQGTRVANSQRSFRTVDIDEVGDNRHTTFFEMLGNWSFGDYFKKEQIPWIFEFCTKELKLDPKRLYVSVFRGLPEHGLPRDEEAARIWEEVFKNIGLDHEIVDMAEIEGMGQGRIFYYDESKNWWSRAGKPQDMPTGEPGGPDSEIFWDFGADLGLHEQSSFKDQPCHINCDCGRFMEIGNSVFMEYVKTEQGFVPLPQKNIDFGGGLERMAAASLDSPDVFTIDVFKAVIEALEQNSAKRYLQDPNETKSFRVIADHLRAATFLIADGAVPSNKDQGYFTRRLIRRAVRFGKKLGFTKPFAAHIAEVYINYYADVYPMIVEKQQQILDELSREEEKFLATLEKGLKEFEKMATDSISGHDAFILFSTYGFPFEMTLELAEERGATVNVGEFNEEFKKHQEQSRTAAAGKFKGGLADHSERTTRLHTANHLLLAALRRVVGDHVYQKGSNITSERLRFDFPHEHKLTTEQLKQVEDLVNEQIKKSLPVTKEEMPLSKAKEIGAMGVFDHKYGDTVNVYSIGDFSVEICGGPHVTNSSEVGTFKILKEESSGAGIRRIKATVE